MIKFFRQAKREILIEFDKGGCDELLSLFSKIKETQIEKLQVQFDMSIIKNKYIGKVDGAEISFVDDKIIWKIDEEYADMSFERFIECDKKQEFSPSEFMYVKVIGRKDLDYLFCDFKRIR